MPFLHLFGKVCAAGTESTTGMWRGSDKPKALAAMRQMFPAPLAQAFTPGVTAVCTTLTRTGARRAVEDVT